MNKESLRMQMLAGIITEGEYKAKLNENEYQFDVMDILKRNGIDEDYFDGMGGKEVESGTEKWMDVVSDVTGEDAYGELSPEASEKIKSFIQAMEDMGIEFI